VAEKVNLPNIRAELFAMQSLAEDLLQIGRRCASLPDLDQRKDEEILGFNEFGAW